MNGLKKNYLIKGLDSMTPNDFLIHCIDISILHFQGNLVILYAILSKRGMRTARNYFILCLAVSDLLLCVLTMPLTLWELLRQDDTSDLKLKSN